MRRSECASNRARRTYWQAHGLFPLPEVRWLSHPGHRGGSRGYYHRDSPQLALLLDRLLGAGRTSSAGRPSPRAVSAMLARLASESPSEQSEEVEAEDAFFDRVEREVERIGQPGELSEVRPAHAEILPEDQGRVAPRRADDARELTATVIEALADEWIEGHRGEPEPERLAIWFRVERDGPDHWRIADHGARLTAHHRDRRRA